MKIATNITRSNVGGITVSNINFLNSIHNSGKGVVAIELVSARHFKGASAFRHFSPEWFDHNIVNVLDRPIFKAVAAAKNVKDLEREYRPVIKTIAKILKDSGVDVVFLNGTYYIPWLISIAAKGLGLPIVLRYAGVYSREMEKFSLPPEAKKVFLEIERSFIKRADHFVFPSSLCRREVESQFSSKGERDKLEKNSSIIPNSVNLPKHIKLEPGRDRRIAAVGRWDPIKNFPTFFKLHRLLLKDGWDHDARFVTVGGKIPGLPKTVKRLKSLPHGRIYEFYASQGLIVSPSHFETFGNVPMEAVAMGVPVLVNENMGCVDVLRKAGLAEMAMPFDDLKAVAERVKELCGRPIPKAKTDIVKRLLSPENINKRLLSVLKKAARHKK
jgi:glycosyltransferase involved in cell wall biosynthesis